MRATGDTIWQVPAYLPYLQPPLTDEAVAAAEKELGYRLPTEFLELLRRQNGGYIRFSLSDMPHDTIAGIGPNFPSLTQFDWEECQEYVSYPLQGLVPFDGDGHWHLCLDYRKNPNAPAITYADVECDSEAHVADSFADYLALLRLAVDDEYVLERVSDVEKLKGDLSRRLGVAFDPPDTYAHGYPTERARLGSDGNPQWLWLSPNTVRRGFVRADDRRYSELKDLLPDYSDRFPGLPANSYILSATDGVRQRVLEACGRAGLTARPLREYTAGISKRCSGPGGHRGPSRFESASGARPAAERQSVERHKRSNAVFGLFKKKEPPQPPRQLPPVPKWQPAFAPPLSKVVERVSYYTNGKRDFAVFRNGTCAILPSACRTRQQKLKPKPSCIRSSTSIRT